MTQPTISGTSNEKIPMSNTPGWMKWTGRVISGLIFALMAFSAAVKLSGMPEVAQGFEKSGYPAKVLIPLGIIELACALVYAVPQTSVLGAILLTGYMGGAIATHVRLEEGFVPQVIIGMLIWLGVFLRDARLRALIPLRRGN
jgi:hypothetical protein